MDNQIVLGYWKFRGRGQVPRLLLSYTGLNWEDKQYEGAQKWFGNGDKSSLGLDFPNLPYLVSGDFKLSETSSICNFIIRKSSKQELLGKTVQDQARVEMVNSLLDDIYQPTFSLFFSPVYDKEKERLFNGKIKEKLEQLAKYVGEKDTAIGYLTLSDFKIAEASYYFEKLYDTQYKDYPFLNKIRNMINQLPEVKKYYEKESSVKEPFLASYSQLKF